MSTISGKPIQPSSVETDADKRLIGELKTVHGEIAQISELRSEEKKLIGEFRQIMQGILGFIDATINVPVHIFPKRERHLKEVWFNKEGLLIMLYEDQSMNSVSLEKFSPKVVVEIARHIVSETIKASNHRRDEAFKRVNLFEQINREARKINQQVLSSTGPEEVDMPEEVFQKVLTEKPKEKEAQHLA